MKNKYKILIIICTIIGIGSLLIGSIAYYRIVVEGNIKGSTGNAVFVLKDENSNVWNNKEINLGKVNPGDSGEFTVTMDASGSTVDMYATLEIEKNSLPTNLKFYTTSDHKSELHKYYSFLEQSGTNSETLTIYWYWNPYISDEEDSKFINIDSIEANVRVSAVQISEYAMMKNGCNYNSSTRTCVGTEFWNDDYRPYIRTITFGNDLSNLPSECTEENLCWDVSYDANQNKKVYGYLIDSGLSATIDNGTEGTIEQSLYNLYIVSEAPIFAPIDCSYIFSMFSFKENNSRLISINFNNNFNTSKVENMYMMFYYNLVLEKIDIFFNTSKVTNMIGMFAGCTQLKELNLNCFNTTKVTDIYGIFMACVSLKQVDLSSFNTENVTNMIGMFTGCSSLTSINLSSFNTSNATTMIGMFAGCSSLTSINLSSFNTSKVTNMHEMFAECQSLTSLDLSNFNTSNVTDMSRMFNKCNQLKELEISNFDTSKVTIYTYVNGSNKYGMFTNCKNLTTTINIMNANATEYTDMFKDAATEEGAKITVNYTAETESLVDQMIATKSSNSNVVKGSLIS